MKTVIHNRHGCTECFVVWSSPLGRSRIIISLPFSFYATVLMVTDFITKRSCEIVCCIYFGNSIILHNNLLREIIIDKPAPSCIIFKSESNHAPPSYYTERYRSGHNGADSKSQNFGRADDINCIRRGIEVVITGLTRKRMPFLEAHLWKTLILRGFSAIIEK